MIGNWTGTKKLHMPWLEPPMVECTSNAAVTPKSEGQFINIEYDWVYEDAPQSGVLLLGKDGRSDAVQCVWTDSWHSKHTLMLSDGSFEDDVINVLGRYKVPDHPDWGWRTLIYLKDQMLYITMYNITPEGEETLAVEFEFSQNN